MFRLLGQYMLLELGLGRYRSEEFMGLFDKWGGGWRQGWLLRVLSPDSGSSAAPLQAYVELFKGVSLVFIPHLSLSQSQS